MVTSAAPLGSPQPPKTKPFKISHFKNGRWFTTMDSHDFAAVQSHAQRVIKKEPQPKSESRETPIPPVHVSLDSPAYSRSPSDMTELAQKNIDPTAAATLREVPVEQTRISPSHHLDFHPVLGPSKFDEIVTIAK